MPGPQVRSSEERIGRRIVKSSSASRWGWRRRPSHESPASRRPGPRRSEDRHGQQLGQDITAPSGTVRIIACCNRRSSSGARAASRVVERDRKAQQEEPDERRERICSRGLTFLEREVLGAQLNTHGGKATGDAGGGEVGVPQNLGAAWQRPPHHEVPDGDLLFEFVHGSG